MFKGFAARWVKNCVCAWWLVAACAGTPVIAAEPAAMRPERELDQTLRRAGQHVDQNRVGIERLAERFGARGSEVDVLRNRDNGFAGGTNFNVLAPRGGDLAREVLAQAELFRIEIAREWLGQELDDRLGLTHICVKLSEDQDRGLSVFCGPGRKLTGDHRIWLTTNRERALGSTLKHEICHIVLETAIPNGLPSWVHEGIASRYDDQWRIADRRDRLMQFARTGQWPSLRSIVDVPSISSEDEVAYTLASSVTDFLVERGGKLEVVTFARDVRSEGWTTPLRRHYGIQDLSELEHLWQAWVADRTVAH